MAPLNGIAFKVTYNDNDGSEARQGLVGFRGVCSDATILMNVRERRATNCADGTPCARYVGGGMKPGARPSQPARVDDTWCYESSILKGGRWAFGAGIYHRGEKRGMPIPIRGGARGDIAILTTRFPGQSEAERSVFAIYRIGKRAVSPETGTWLESDGSMDVMLPSALARDVRYWDYAEADPDWRTGLFRYLTPKATERLLSEVMYLLGDRDERDRILKAVGPGIRPMPPPRDRWALLGEGEAHRKLKARVAENPALIGLPANARPAIERAFISGDRVDIAFDLAGGSHAVVEIETYFTEPGAYQAIKYRALMEAECGVPLGSGKVEAVLVAHACDERTRSIAERYGVRVVVVDP